MAKRFHGIGDFVRPLWPFCLNADSPQAQGLVRWWPLGYWPGNEFDLVSGQQLTNTGTVATPTSAGVMRTCRDFNGTNQFLQRADVPVAAVPLSLACWFLADGDAQDGLVSLNDNTVNNRFSLRTELGRTIRAATNTRTATTTATFTAGAWSHALARFTTATLRDAFVNGAGKVSNTDSATPTGLVQTDVGQEGGGGGDYAGLMADVRIYSRAITDLEAASFFSDPRLSLDLYYPLGRRVWSFPKRSVTFKPYPRPRGLEAGMSVLSGGMQ